MLDNLSAHKAPEVADWLAHPRRDRWHLHFTPTSWFKELADRRLRRGTFTSVPDLIAPIGLWVEHWNVDPKPFVWQAEAGKIMEKVRRGRKTLSKSNLRRTTRPPLSALPEASFAQLGAGKATITSKPSPSCLHICGA